MYMAPSAIASDILDLSMEYVFSIIADFWATVTEMSPYLLFGFLVAGILSVLMSQQAVTRHLGGRGIWPLVKASVVGVPLPLVSYGGTSMVTLMIGFGILMSVQSEGRKLSRT